MDGEASAGITRVGHGLALSFFFFLMLSLYQHSQKHIFKYFLTDKEAHKCYNMALMKLITSYLQHIPASPSGPGTLRDPNCTKQCA